LAKNCAVATYAGCTSWRAGQRRRKSAEDRQHAKDKHNVRQLTDLVVKSKRRSGRSKRRCRMIELRTLASCSCTSNRGVVRDPAQPKRLAPHYLALSTAGSAETQSLPLLADSTPTMPAARFARRCDPAGSWAGVLNGAARRSSVYSAALVVRRDRFERACDAGAWRGLELYAAIFSTLLVSAPHRVRQWVTAKRARLKNLAVEARGPARDAAKPGRRCGGDALGTRHSKSSVSRNQALMQTCAGGEPPAWASRPSWPGTGLVFGWVVGQLRVTSSHSTTLDRPLSRECVSCGSPWGSPRGRRA